MWMNNHYSLNPCEEFSFFGNFTRQDASFYTFRPQEGAKHFAISGKYAVVKQRKRHEWWGKTKEDKTITKIVILLIFLLFLLLIRTFQKENNPPVKVQYKSCATFSLIYLGVTEETAMFERSKTSRLPDNVPVSVKFADDSVILILLQDGVLEVKVKWSEDSWPAAQCL